jgi:hypothetical protein
VDEEPAAHLDQRMIPGVNDSKYKERARATILAPFSFDFVIIVHLCTSVYIAMTQYSPRLGQIVEVHVPFILLTSSQYALVYIGGEFPPSAARRN